MIKIYGIPNCDTVRKARRWLDVQDVRYTFYDYKKEGTDPAKLAEWSDAVGWETLLNRRGTTFRNLPDIDKADIDRARAMALMTANPSLIKRPVVEHEGGILVGFDEARWAKTLV